MLHDPHRTGGGGGVRGKKMPGAGRVGKERKRKKGANKVEGREKRKKGRTTVFGPFQKISWVRIWERGGGGWCPGLEILWVRIWVRGGWLAARA